jgi:DNA primase
MNVDLGSIKASNIDEWAFRLNVLYDIGLSAFPKPLTKAELKKYIGLSTNVSTKTRRQFMKKISDHIARKAQEYVENPRRKKTKKRKR